MLFLIPLSIICLCSSGATNVTDCPLQNGSACDIRRVPTPVTVLFTISLTATRALSGALFWCESELDLGPEGPQLPVRFRSQPLNLTVHCKIQLSFVGWHGDGEVKVVLF